MPKVCLQLKSCYNFCNKNNYFICLMIITFAYWNWKSVHMLCIGCGTKNVPSVELLLVLLCSTWWKDACDSSYGVWLPAIWCVALSQPSYDSMITFNAHSTMAQEIKCRNPNLNNGVSKFITSWIEFIIFIANYKNIHCKLHLHADAQIMERSFRYESLSPSRTSVESTSYFYVD